MEEIMDMKIYKTKDYDQFIILKDHNRDVCNGIVLNSIREKNLLPEKPILVTKNFEVLDGQHRLAAAKELDLEIYYTFSREGVSEEDLGVLNTQVCWTAKDYLKLYSKEGNAYDVIQRIVEEFKLQTNISFLLKVLCHHPRNGFGNVFKKGHLELKFSEEQSFEYIKKICELKYLIQETINNVSKIDANGIYALFDIITTENYDHDQALKRFGSLANKDRLRDSFQWKAVPYISDALKNIYNLHTAVRLK